MTPGSKRCPDLESLCGNLSYFRTNCWRLCPLFPPHVRRGRQQYLFLETLTLTLSKNRYCCLPRRTQPAFWKATRRSWWLLWVRTRCRHCDKTVFCFHLLGVLKMFPKRKKPACSIPLIRRGMGEKGISYSLLWNSEPEIIKMCNTNGNHWARTISHHLFGVLCVLFSIRPPEQNATQPAVSCTTFLRRPCDCLCSGTLSGASRLFPLCWSEYTITTNYTQYEYIRIRVVGGVTKAQTQNVCTVAEMVHSTGSVSCGLGTAVVPDLVLTQGKESMEDLNMRVSVGTSAMRDSLISEYYGPTILPTSPLDFRCTNHHQ